MFDQPPTDRLGEIGTKYEDQVHVNTLTAFWYAPMNTNLAPFDNVKARQAVNYAIDRNAAVKIFGGPRLAAPSCQVLPPGLPRHMSTTARTRRTRARKWSAPDIEKAKQLVEESGTTGQKVAVVDARRRGQQGDRRLSPERAQRDRLQGDREADLAEHLLHLRPEHEEQGADQRAAVVPGLPRRIGLPLRPVRLRAFHPAATPPSTSPASATRRSTPRCTRRSTLGVDERGRRQQDLGEDRPGW